MDNWLDGRNRPAPENVRALARALARNGESAAVERAIRWCCALSVLATRLADELGRQRVEELGTALVLFVRAIDNDVERMERARIEESAGTELIALWYGAAHPMSRPLLRNLATVEKDAEWRRDILASMRPWGMALEQVALQAAGVSEAAGIAREALGPTDVGRDADRAAMAALGRLVAATDHPAGADLARKIDQLRSIARRYPESARAHFEAGAFMGMAGKWLGRRALIDEGIGECWVGARLSPGWDAPAVEPGVMLCNVGEFRAALSELERAEEWLGARTPHLLLCRGYAKMGRWLHGEALADFQAVLAEHPDHGMALGWSARCAFAIGEKREGLTLARRAMRFGVPEEYLAWRSRKTS